MRKCSRMLCSLPWQLLLAAGRPLHKSSSHATTSEVSHCNESRNRVLPINIVIAHRIKERSTEAQDGLAGGVHPWATSLSHRLYGCQYITPQITHPAANSI